MAATQSNTTPICFYRLYFRDARNVLTAPHEVDLTSDEEACALAALMLEEQGMYEVAEI